MSRKFYITEVFSESAYGGNQLATLPDAGDLSGEEMQKIARAFNYAESTFIVGGSLESGFDVRIFTPNTELPFAGHPTLGTSFLIRDLLLDTPEPVIQLNLGVGPITVTFEEDGVQWMRQNEPGFGDVLDADEVAKDIGLQPDQIDPAFPCQPVSTGLEFLMVPLTSYAALKQSQIARGKLAQGYFLFCRGGYSPDQQIQARMYATALGVPEDPATGSANGCLAAYLAEHEYFGGGAVNVRVGQGYEINRPSQLYLRSEKNSDEFIVDVGGKVRLIAEGTWLI